MKRKIPRDYQKDIIDQVVKSNKSTLIQIPTGGGKTFIAYEIATDLIAKFDQQVLFVAPRENLVHQTAEEFKFAKPHIVHTSNKEDKGIMTYDFETYPLLISTLQTAYRRDNIDPNVIIIDETHFGFDGKMIKKLKASNKHSRIIGLSATPYDKYGQQLQGFDLVLDKYDMNYMIENKYLVPLQSYKRQKIKGLNNIKIVQGDYDLRELEEVVCNNHTIIEIVETTKDKVAESEKTIVFAVTIKHADLLAEAYRKAGLTSKSLHSKSEDRDTETIDYFKRGHIKVLVSVSKLTTGFDVPSADCAVIARPTKSQNLYKQMVGRILRLSPETGKTHAVLLDCGNVIDELGDPLAPIKLMQPKESNNTLKCNICQSENMKLKKHKDKAYWECQECGHLKKIKAGAYKCNHCNHYSDKNSKFIFTETKILLNCNFCNNRTVISEFLGDEALVYVDDTGHSQANDYDKKSWMKKIWDWADENNISDTIKSEGKIQGLPRNENELLNLTVLDLSSYYLTEIPKEVFNLTNLTALSLSDTGISTLPKEIGNLVNLRELYLDNNSLMEIPVEIGTLTNLTYLNLHFNKLTKFPKEIGSLVNLIELNFSSNKLSTLPKEFFNLVNLVKLNLGNNQIIYLSYKIGNLVNLTVLDLNSNNLTEIPRELFNLTNLTALTLSENKISTLPSGIGNLINSETINLQAIVGLSNKMEKKLKKIIEMQVQAEREEAIAKEMKAQRIAKKKSPITLDKFENLFQTKTEKYLQKKEKSFSNTLDFEKFLKSEAYKQITITRRKQILEGYELIDEYTKISYDLHGFDKSGIHKDTGYTTDKYGHRKDYYINKTVPNIEEYCYDQYGFDKDGIHQDTRYLTDKYGHHKDYYANKNKPRIQVNHYDKHGFDTKGIHKDTGFSTDKYGHRKDYYVSRNE